MCDRFDNGSAEFILPNYKLIWPEGYKHYIEHHDLIPSPYFIDVILDEINLQEPPDDRQTEESFDHPVIRAFDGNVFRIMAGFKGLDYKS